MSTLDSSVRTLTKFFRIASLGATLVGVSACGSVHLQHGTALGGGRIVLKDGNPSISFDFNFQFDLESEPPEAGPAQDPSDDHGVRERMLEALSALDGLEQIPGSEHNPIIQAMHASVGLRDEADETAWCSSAVNFIAEQAGVAGTGSAAARSWLTWSSSRPISLSDARPGDVVVIWRESVHSWKGHVGLYVGPGADAGTILVLGGNQGGSVNVSTYRVDRLLGVRRVVRR
jgi:uncharacterized protein (TIGR02594 family)